MAKKQVKVPAVSKKAKAAKVSDVPELPALTQEEVLKLRLFDMEAKLAQQEAKAVAVERQSFLAKVDPQNRLGVFENQRAQCVDRERQARASYKAAIEAASKRLGFDIGAGCSIDPETGTIIQHEKKE